MKRTIRLVSLLLVLAALCAAFAGCSKVSQSYADKVNKAAKDDKHYTYDKVMKDLGDEAIDWTIEAFGVRAGAVIAVKGCKSKEDLQKKVDEGKDVKGIVITIVAGKATAAEYKVIKAEDLK